MEIQKGGAPVYNYLPVASQQKTERIRLQAGDKQRVGKKMSQHVAIVSMQVKPTVASVHVTPELSHALGIVLERKGHTGNH
jgi:hypothetical protein